MNINIDVAVKGMLGVFSVVTGRWPQFRANGGSHRENLALQNVQVGLTLSLCRLQSSLSVDFFPLCSHPGSGPDGPGLPVCPVGSVGAGEARRAAGAGLGQRRREVLMN